MFIKHHLKTIMLVLLIGFIMSGTIFSILHQWELEKKQDTITYRSEHRLTAMRNTFDEMIEATAYLGDFIQTELKTEHDIPLATKEFTIYANIILEHLQTKGLLSLVWLPNTTVKDADFRPPLYISFSNNNKNKQNSIFNFQKHIQETKGQASLTMDLKTDKLSHQVMNVFLPVFSNTGSSNIPTKLLGHIISQWDIGKAIEHATKQLPVSGLHFFLMNENNKLIHMQVSRSFKGIFNPEKSSVIWKKDFSIAEHIWTLKTSLTPAFIKKNLPTLSYLSLAFGLFITLGLAKYISIILKRQKDIEDKVGQRTKALTESEHSLAKAQEITHLGSWTWFIQSKQLHWSDETFRVFGRTPNSFDPTLNFLNNAIHTDDRALLKQAVDASFQGKPYDFTHRITLPDGNIRIVHERGNVEFDQKNKPLKMIGTVQDITEKVQAEKKLQRLHMALAETAEPIIITNKSGNIRYVNHAFEVLSGYTSQEVLTKKPSIVSSGQHPQSYYKQMWKTISGGQPWLGTFTNRSKKGQLYIVEQTISPIHDQQGEINGYVAVQRDITLEDEKRRQMEHTQRLESLGILAGGIAHDFNNLLTAILGHASFIEKKHRTEQSIDKHLNNIVTASNRAADLCQQMLAYSGQGAYQMDWLDLSQLIHEMNELLQVSLHHQTVIDIDTDTADVWFYADSAQIQQVIMNLVINASEALSQSKENGKITITTYCKHMQPEDFKPCFKAAELVAGDYICLRVQDNGCGMDNETQAKIFDPFFTTKFSGRGLGMSAVLGIIQAHKGAVQLSTQINVGTIFEVFFPCSKQRPNKKETKKPQYQPIENDKTKATKQTVLIIDDEDFILEVAQAVLEDEGYAVVTAISPEQGIDYFAQHHKEINITIIDMTMPQMDGIACAQAIRALDASAIIVLSSGYTDESITNNRNNLKLNGFLQKPYSATLLIQQVEKLL